MTQAVSFRSFQLPPHNTNLYQSPVRCSFETGGSLFSGSFVGLTCRPKLIAPSRQECWAEDSCVVLGAPYMSIHSSLGVRSLLGIHLKLSDQVHIHDVRSHLSLFTCLNDVLGRNPI